MPMTDRQRLEGESWLSVVHAYLACTRRYAQMLEHFDLTIPQFDLMSAVYRQRGNATPKAIAADMFVTPGNVTGLMTRLEAQGLLARRPHATDGRSCCCELTEDGLALFREARAAASRFISAQLQPFDDDDLTRTRDQMLEMRAHLDALDPHSLADAGNQREARHG